MSINGINPASPTTPTSPTSPINNNLAFKGAIDKTKNGNEYKKSSMGINLGIGLPMVGFAAYDVVKNGGFKKCFEMMKQTPNN